ncbi:hypothetical protein J9B83_04865 [Marinomonas sp. A79]|uniref:Uncharacterized protein n=1 Tax=Marinomonas vulgaris TaxID=2823372 RepID=A0ABS5H9A3_9GAMM|nr:hypothetical protein [Marinomonas vulgaris]MBR7888268.1 hypothetical protein [Marinomonas vulgaris]
MFILRSLIYLFGMAGIAHLISLEGYQLLSDAQYSEHSLTEYLQDGFTLLSCVLFLIAAKMDERLHMSSTLLACLMAMMFVRESDAFLDAHVFDGAWQLIVTLIIIYAIVFVWGRIPAAYQSLKAYSMQPSFGIFVAGIVAVVAFSRMMGRGSFWQAVMGDSYMRVVKNIVEEGIETFGYSLIVIAAVELTLVCVRLHSKKKSPYFMAKHA